MAREYGIGLRQDSQFSNDIIIHKQLADYMRQTDMVVLYQKQYYNRVWNSLKTLPRNRKGKELNPV